MTTRTHHGRIIDLSIRLDAAPQRVWDAWADPEQIANWFVDRANGTAAAGEVMTWFFESFNYRQPVPIVEAEPGKSFVVGSGDVPGPHGHPYLMEIAIAREAGATTLRLVNSGFSEDASFDDEYGGVVSGWQLALRTLKHWLEHYPERTRAHRLVMQPAAYTWDILHSFLHTSEGRRLWLDEMLPGDARPLIDTGREVLLEWLELEGVLGLKAFAMGPRKMLALDFSTWADRSVELDETAHDMKAALQRLVRTIEA